MTLFRYATVQMNTTMSWIKQSLWKLFNRAAKIIVYRNSAFRKRGKIYQILPLLPVIPSFIEKIKIIFLLNCIQLMYIYKCDGSKYRAY